jgi:hypothetical protein
MKIRARSRSLTATTPRPQRWLLGLEPIFEGGWFHRGRRARRWDVEPRLDAIALFGDVEIDLTAARTSPDQVQITAYAIGRDIDVLVPAGTHVELSGRRHNDHLANRVPVVLEADRHRSVRIVGHTFLGDITVRTLA